MFPLISCHHTLMSLGYSTPPPLSELLSRSSKVQGKLPSVGVSSNHDEPKAPSLRARGFSVPCPWRGLCSDPSTASQGAPGTRGFSRPVSTSSSLNVFIGTLVGENRGEKSKYFSQLLFPYCESRALQRHFILFNWRGSLLQLLRANF